MKMNDVVALSKHTYFYVKNCVS